MFRRITGLEILYFCTQSICCPAKSGFWDDLEFLTVIDDWRGMWGIIELNWVNFGGEIFMEGFVPQLCLPYCFYISMFYYVCVCACVRVHDSRRDIVARPSAEWWAVNRCNELPEWWLIPLICDNRPVHTATPKAATHTRSCTINVLVCLAARL